MIDELSFKRLLVLVSTAIAALFIWLVPVFQAEEPSPYLQVHFLDVGQGDSTLIETPDGVQVLIDGGRDAGVLRQLAKYMSVWDRDIDVVIATHPDQDHIGGLVDVLERFSVATLIATDKVGDTATAAAYQSGSQREGANLIKANRGQVLQLGASTSLEVLYPEGSVAESETNAASIVMQLHYGDTTFMLTGDSPKRIEEYLVLAYGEHLKSDVLKVGHHGSRTSTSELFLAEVDPDYAVISAGKDNRYGHPHVEVTDALFNYGVTTYNTAEYGNVTFYSDGEKVFNNTFSPF